MGNLLHDVQKSIVKYPQSEYMHLMYVVLRYGSGVKSRGKSNKTRYMQHYKICLHHGLHNF